MPMREMRCAGRPPMSSPRKRMWPALGARSPERRLSSVVFPAPFGPITACTEPARKARLTASTAVRPPNCRLSASVSIIGFSDAASLILVLDLGHPAAAADPGEAVGEQQHDQDDEHADAEQPELGQRLQRLLEQNEHESADHRAQARSQS